MANRKETVRTIVDDPGYKDGKIVHLTGKYDIKITSEKFVGRKWETVHTNVITVYPHLYRVVMGIYIVLMTIITGIAVILGDLSDDFGWANAILATQLLHLGLSLADIKEDERGGILFWGKPVQEIESGWVFIPLGFLQLKKLSRKPIQVQFPGEPEAVYKRHDNEYFALSTAEREQFVLPIRATTGAPETKVTGEAGILNTQMTLEISFYVRWVVEQFWVFHIRVGSEGEANRQFRDQGERVIIQQIASRTPAKVISELSQINEALAERFEWVTQDLGINFVETAMLSPDTNHEVNQSLRDLVKSKAAAAKTLIDSEAEKRKRILEGEGAAAAKLADLRAQAEGARDLSVSGAEVLELEKAKAHAQGNTTVIVDGGNGASSLVGLATRFGVGTNQATQAQNRNNQGRNQNRPGQNPPTGQSKNP